MAGAAVLEQKAYDVAQSVEVGAVDDRPALPARCHQPCALQLREVGGHGVVRNVQKPRDLPCRQSVRFMLDQEPESVEPRRLSEGGKGGDSVNCVHLSRYIDMW